MIIPKTNTALTRPTVSFGRLTTVIIPRRDSFSTIKESIYPDLIKHLSTNKLAPDVYCFLLSFKNKAMDKAEIQMCTRTQRERHTWVSFFNSQNKCNSMGSDGNQEGCLWKTRGDEEKMESIDKHMNNFIKLPYAQRMMHGYAVMRCGTVESKASCRIERTRSDKPSHSGLLWKLGTKKAAQATKTFAVIESDVLALYQTIEERRTTKKSKDKYVQVKDILLNQLKIVVPDDKLMPNILSTTTSSKTTFTDDDPSLSNYQESFVDWVRKDESEQQQQKQDDQDDQDTASNLTPTCFQILTLCSDGTQQNFVFCASTRAEIETWMTAIRVASRSFYGIPPLLRDRKKSLTDIPTLENTISKLGPMPGLKIKRSWSNERTITMTDTRLVVTETRAAENNKKYEWSHSYADITDVSLHDSNHIPTKGNGKSMSKDMKSTLDSKTSMCLSFKLPNQYRTRPKLQVM